MINYVQGDATVVADGQTTIIAHVVNDRGGWGKGFVLALSKRYPQAEAAYRRWSRQPAAEASPFALGEVQMVEITTGLWVANMLAQHGYRTPDNPVPLRYDALERCLSQLAEVAESLNAAVQMPRIGAGLAGGDWDRIEALIARYFASCKVTIYEL